MGFWNAATEVRTSVVKATGIDGSTEVGALRWFRDRVGAPVVDFDVVYKDGDYWKQARNGNPSTARPPLSIVRSLLSGAGTPISSGETVLSIAQGRVQNSSWAFTSGARAFLGTSGDITATPPTASGSVVVTLGRFYSAIGIEFDPDAKRVVQIGD